MMINQSVSIPRRTANWGPSLALLLLLGSTPVAAQDITAPSPPSAAPATLAASHVDGWALTEGAALATAAQVRTEGPGHRVSATVPTRVLRAGRRLTGAYTVTALFSKPEAGVAEYGLIVGAEQIGSLLCAIRSDGFASVQRGASTAPAWQPREIGAPSGAASDVQRLEVRVTGSVAECLVNDVVVDKVPTAAGELDGTPGVYVGAGTSVQVLRFTVQAKGLRP